MTPPPAQTPAFDIKPLSRDSLSAMAAVHAASFETPWDAAALSGYLTPNAVALGGYVGGVLSGFILLGPCTDQTDMLTLAVIPQARGMGYGRALVQAAQARAAAKGCELIFLEAAEDNSAALALYKSCGYVPIGTRKNYYKRAGGRISAVTMRKSLRT